MVTDDASNSRFPTVPVDGVARVVTPASCWFTSVAATLSVKLGPLEDPETVSVWPGEAVPDSIACSAPCPVYTAHFAET